MSSKKTHLSTTGQYVWNEGDTITPYVEDNVGTGTNYALTGKESDESISSDINKEENAV